MDHELERGVSVREPLCVVLCVVCTEKCGVEDASDAWLWIVVRDLTSLYWLSPAKVDIHYRDCPFVYEMIGPNLQNNKSIILDRIS